MWAWEGEKNGLYSVRSAYKLLAANERIAGLHNQQFACPSFDEADPVWCKIWKMAIPPKIKAFWWRVTHNFVPVRANLHRRHMEDHANCLDCGVAEDTVFHALTVCPLSKQFWSLFRELFDIKLPILHPLTWATDLLDVSLCPPPNACAILCGMWAVWKARNDRRHGKIPLNLEAACRWARDTSADLVTEARNLSGAALKLFKPAIWSPPPVEIGRASCRERVYVLV